jgi:5-methylcytosine-specific restriction endonuclease McrA
MGREYPVPAVIANQHHVKRKYRKVPFSRRNILRRDKFTCQYCGKSGSPQDLTLDHVVPRSMWQGKDTPTCWKNIVASCVRCNRKKGNRTPEQAEMTLRKNVRGNIVAYKKPKQPSYQEIALRLYMRNIPDEWVPYVKTINKDL